MCIRDRLLIAQPLNPRYPCHPRLKNNIPNGANHLSLNPNQDVYKRQEPVLFLGRGYTGHEHLTAFGLINMNARLYDPVIGRFLSPDPRLQNPYSSQNYNRYSYCLNNPLVYTDPNGEFFFCLLYTSAAYQIYLRQCR